MFIQLEKIFSRLGTQTHTCDLAKSRSQPAILFIDVHVKGGLGIVCV